MNACMGSTGTIPAPSCALPPVLYFSSSLSTSAAQLQCPSAQLSSFASYTAGLPPSLVETITLPFPTPMPIGSVIGGSGLTGYFGCSCSSGYSISVSNGAVSCVSTDTGGGGPDRKYIIAIVLVAILPMAVLALGAFFFIK